MSENTIIPPEKFPHSITLISWGLNEEENVESFLDKAFETLEDVADNFELIFINDGSTDRTGDIVNRFSEKDSRLRVIHNEKNINVALSCRKAIADVQTDYFFWQTADWSYDLEQLPIFLKLLSYYDVVHGVRPYPERPLAHIPGIRSVYRVKTRSDSIKKALISLTNYYLVRTLFGVQFHDFQNITFFRTNLVKALDLHATTPFLSPEILIKLYSKGHSFLEVPIKFIPRKGGKSTGTQLPILIRSFSDIIKNWLDWGCKIRFGINKGKGSISRTRDPIFIDEPVFSIVAPLLKNHR